MDMQFVLQDVLRIFTDDSLILVPCLYVILWTLKRTPVIKNTVWLYAWIMLAAGAVCSVFLNGFSFYQILRGMLAAGLAEFLYQTNEKRHHMKCMPCKKHKNR